MERRLRTGARAKALVPVHFLGEWVLCPVGRGLYGGTPATTLALDFVMPPADGGCCNEHPLYPRVPGAPPPGPPNDSCAAFLPSAASLRRQAPPGDLPGGMRMCTNLPQPRRHSGALPMPPLLPRSPSANPVRGLGRTGVLVPGRRRENKSLFRCRGRTCFAAGSVYGYSTKAKRGLTTPAGNRLFLRRIPGVPKQAPLSHRQPPRATPGAATGCLPRSAPAPPAWWAVSARPAAAQ